MKATFVTAALLAGCGFGGYGNGTYVVGSRWEAADVLFHQDPQWLGGDGAITVDLGDDRTLWMFGDSFVGSEARRESHIVHNSVAVMTGRDPLTATMDHQWRRDPTPAAFFADLDDDRYLTPSTGLRVLEGPLVVFLTEKREAPPIAIGTRAARVLDPDVPPDVWTYELADVLAGEVVACSAVDAPNGELVGIAVDGARTARTVRWSLDKVAANDFSAPKWGDPIFEDAPLECTLRYDAEMEGWVLMTTGAMGSMDIRWAGALDAKYQIATQAYVHPPAVRRAAITYSSHMHDLPDDPDRPSFTGTFVERTLVLDDVYQPEHSTTLFWPQFVRFDYAVAVE